MGYEICQPKNCPCCNGIGYHYTCQGTFKCIRCRGTGSVDPPSAEIEIGALRGCTVSDTNTPEGQVNG